MVHILFGSFAFISGLLGFISTHSVPSTPQPAALVDAVQLLSTVSPTPSSNGNQSSQARTSATASKGHASTPAAPTSIVYQYLPATSAPQITLSGVTEAELAAKLAALQSQIDTIAGYAPPFPSGLSQSFALTNAAVGDSSGATANNLTVDGVHGLTDADIPDTITASNYLTLSGGSVTSLTLSSALGVASGGTGWNNINSGSILFGNGSSALGTSSNLFWDNTNGRLGIGTTTPGSLLSVGGNSYFGGNTSIGRSSGDIINFNAGIWNLNAIPTTLSDELAQAPSGNINPLTYTTTVDNAALDGTSDVRSMVSRIDAYGANPYTEVRTRYSGVDLYTTDGTSTNAYVDHNYVYLHGGGSVDYAFDYFGHLVARGTGGILDGRIFEAGPSVLQNGGYISTVKGFYTADLGGGGTNVNTVYAFRADDTNAISAVYGYDSEITSGTGKWGFYEDGDANNAFAGAVQIGSTAVPTTTLSVTGSGYFTGGLGLGVLNLVPNSLTMSSNGSDKTLIQDVSATQAIFRKITASGVPTVDIDPQPGDGISNATVRLFRATNTSGTPTLVIERGNNTATIDAQISAGTSGSTFFAANGGNVGIGVNVPTATLHIGGTNTGSNQYVQELVTTLASSNTSAQYGALIQPTFSPTGASLASIYGFQSIPILSASSAIAPTTLTGGSFGIKVASGFTGTVVTGVALNIENPVSTGSNPIASYRGIAFSTNTNGNGTTTGTVTNRNIFDIGPTAAAAAGGTISNYTGEFTLGSASGAGTTNNRAIYITGNGSTAGAGTTNNYALYSDSTANSYFAGSLGIGTSTLYSRLTLWGPDTSAGTAAFTIANNASTTELQVFDDGHAVLAGALTQSSDQRLKTNVQPLDGLSNLAEIEALNPVTFDWVNGMFGAGHQLGFIAQQVQPTFPQLVSTTSPTALTPDGTLGLNYTGLIAPIVGAIKALASQVADLEQTVSGFANQFTTKQLCLSDAGGTSCYSRSQLDAFLGHEEAQGSVASSPSADTPPTAPTDTEPISTATTTPADPTTWTDATSTPAVPSFDTAPTPPDGTVASSTPS